MPVNQWSTIVLSQENLSEVFIFKLTVNGVAALAIENTQPREFKSVKVFVSNPWEVAQPGLIRALSIQTNGEKTGKICCQIMKLYGSIFDLTRGLN